MTFVIRAAREDDLAHLYEMAKLTGGGFTNLPPDRKALRAKLDRAAAAFARDDEALGDDQFVLILENLDTGEVRGTCQLFTQIGRNNPFYSYRIGTLTQHSSELDRTFRADMLTLATDLEGASEVGGLFLHPGERAGGLGMLLARSRYLFIKAHHRARFADHIARRIAWRDRRGGRIAVLGRVGRALLRHEFPGRRSVQRHQRSPVHRRSDAQTSDLHRHAAPKPRAPRSACRTPPGRAAMRMLENEGFAFEDYIDIFDGGPTMTDSHRRRYARSRDARDAVIDRDRSAMAAMQALVVDRRTGSVISAASYGTDSRRSKTRIVLDREIGDRGMARSSEDDGGPATSSAWLMPRRDQLRRHHRAEPQLRRPQPRQSRRDAAMPVRWRIRGRRRCRVSPRCARIWRWG